MNAACLAFLAVCLLVEAETERERLMEIFFFFRADNFELEYLN